MDAGEAAMTARGDGATSRSMPPALPAESAERHGAFVADGR